MGGGGGEAGVAALLPSGAVVSGDAPDVAAGGFSGDCSPAGLSPTCAASAPEWEVSQAGLLRPAFRGRSVLPAVILGVRFRLGWGCCCCAGFVSGTGPCCGSMAAMITGSVNVKAIDRNKKSPPRMSVWWGNARRADWWQGFRCAVRRRGPSSAPRYVPARTGRPG